MRLEARRIILWLLPDIWPSINGVYASQAEGPVDLYYYLRAGRVILPTQGTVLLLYLNKYSNRNES